MGQIHYGSGHILKRREVINTDHLYLTTESSILCNRAIAAGISIMKRGRRGMILKGFGGVTYRRYPAEQLRDGYIGGCIAKESYTMFMV